eukprot:3534702-Rhodomonas_salina.3
MHRAVTGLGGKAAEMLGDEFGTLPSFLEAMSRCADLAACETMLKDVCKRRGCRALSQKCVKTIWTMWCGE